jgi:hypothetical protein
VALQRDDNEEPLARIDRTIADLRRHADRLKREHQQTIEEARLLRERSASARRALRRLRLHSTPKTTSR